VVVDGSDEHPRTAKGNVLTAQIGIFG